jgi:hypothetical protein
MTDVTAAPPASPPSNTPPAAPPAAPPASQPWYHGADETVIGALQTRGWDKKPANEAAIEAVKSYNELNRQRGFPANEVVRFNPADADVMKGFYARIGVPKDAAGYDFSQIKFTNGDELDDPAFTDAVRGAALKHNLTPAQAQGMFGDLLKFQEQTETQSQTNAEAAIATEKDALQKNWGNNFNLNLLEARAGAKALGFDEQIVGTLEKEVGYAKIMEALRSVGARFREPGAVGAGGTPGQMNGGVTTREQAVLRKQELLADSAWRQRYVDGGPNSAERREMHNLDRLLSQR